MRVRKVKKKKIEPKKPFFDSKEKIIGFSIGAAVLVILLTVIMVFELKDAGKLIIENDTDMELEYVSTNYILGEEDLTQPLKTGSIEANKTLAVKADPFNYVGYDANYKIKFKFKDHDELYVDAGLFANKFTGDTKIVFDKTKDSNKLKMMVKAKTGIIQSRQISLDDEYTVDFERGLVYQ